MPFADRKTSFNHLQSGFFTGKSAKTASTATKGEAGGIYWVLIVVGGNAWAGRAVQVKQLLKLVLVALFAVDAALQHISRLGVCA